MRERLLRIGILAGVLFAVNVVGRLIVRIGGVEEVTAQQRWTLVAYGVIGLAMAVAGVSWARRRPLGIVAADLAGAAVAAGVLVLTVGPFVSGTTPAEVGAGDSFEAAWQYAGFAAGGAAVGVLLLTMLGLDYRSQSLKRFAEAKSTRPARRY
ncbi:hypothetical protein JQS43_20235 [Natronosporangium hydrolyticum]|uniref:Uncharacterized protein n=1 Tax=Natronosporangium hydrolyticum TaxID=2811111 RepID=A0A895YH52_9ACTN|nr:hypothetical protein [Natronosporangium hydrolyticum]QSB13856.1 hypothetical protein JQS43_20235 [Natronosporangium hydrolyticum]